MSTNNTTAALITHFSPFTTYQPTHKALKDVSVSLSLCRKQNDVAAWMTFSPSSKHFSPW